MTPWELQALEFSSCNCDFGCPCQFNGLPTTGQCEAFVGLQIDAGYFGDTSLAGVRAAVLMQWPGAVHEGGGKALPIIDPSASEAQREGILNILAGMETEEGATIFNVFAATYETLEPRFIPVELSVDVDARLGSLRVAGIGESVGQPLLNPITREEHRARIDLPHGFEYALAEVGRATFSTTGPITMTNSDTHAHFARLHMNNQGVVRDQAA